MLDFAKDAPRLPGRMAGINRSGLLPGSAGFPANSAAGWWHQIATRQGPGQQRLINADEAANDRVLAIKAKVLKLLQGPLCRDSRITFEQMK